MKPLLEDALIGSSVASIGVIAVRLNGFNWVSLSAVLYLSVVAALISGFKSRSSLSPGFLDRLVLVVEGEEMKIKKLISGEKYRIKGDLEKLQ